MYTTDVFYAIDPMTWEWHDTWSTHRPSDTWFKAAEIVRFARDMHHVSVLGNASRIVTDAELQEWLLFWAEKKAHFIFVNKDVLQVWMQKYVTK